MAVTYSKHTIRFGVGSLDLRRAVDLVDTLNATVLTNAVRLPDGGWTSRFGQTLWATTGVTNVHSLVRGTDPQSGTTSLFAGAGSHLYAGLANALTDIDSGYSGQPLSLVPWEVLQSGQAWVVIGDTAKMRKVRVSDNTVLPVGLPEPSAAPAVAAGAQHKKVIYAFDSKVGWTNTLTGGATAPTIDVPGDLPSSATCVKIVTAPGTATKSYTTAISRPLAADIDLTTYGGGVDATDDDYINFWLRVSSPVDVAEVRFYMITGTTWGAGTTPGTSQSDNQNAYYHAFRPSDVTPIIQGESSVATTPTIVNRRLNADGTKAPLTQDEAFPDTTTTPDFTATSQSDSSQQNIGNYAWTQWGSVGIPLRRGDFQQIGKPVWSSIHAIMVYILTTSKEIVTVEVGDCYLTGGAGPDTGEPGAQKYDYVYSNYDPRTGAEGNASVNHLQAESTWMNALRSELVITPSAGSDAAWRQRMYRRGGVLTDNWRYVGQNASNGGAFTDTLSDTEIAAADTAPTDYFAAVPSVNSSGTAVLAKAVPYVWGPLQNLIFAAGDTNRPGAVYYPYPGSVDQWSATGYADVASSTEAIQGGFILGSQGFAWGTQRLYALNINLNDSQAVTSTVTECTRAPITPWAHTVGGGVDWFLANDGIYATNGGTEINVTDQWLRPIFQWVRANGLAPIDLTATTAMRLAFYYNELHVFYQDIDGIRNGLVYHVLDKLWRHVYFENAVNCPFADVTAGTSRLLFGTAGAGKVLTYSGRSDTGTAIAVRIRTGADNEGYPKSYKRFSDVTTDVAPNGVDVTLAPLVRYNEAGTTPGTAVFSGNERQPFITSFTPDPVLSLTLGLEYTWSTTSTPPVLYSAATTFEVEPPTITRWTSLPTDHGAPGWQMVTGMYLALRSNATVTLTVCAFGQGGTLLYTDTYDKSNTSFEKVKDWIPFTASKGAFYTYQLSSPEPFVLYTDETTVFFSLWGGTETKMLPIIAISREGTVAFEAANAAAAATEGR